MNRSNCLFQSRLHCSWGALLALIAPGVAVALPVEWPLDSRPMTRVIFSPHSLNEFAHMEGLKKFRNSAENLNQYLFRSPTAPWVTSMSCDAPTRNPGFLHTTKYVNTDPAYQGRIAFPVSLNLTTSVTELKRAQMLRTPFITAKVLALDGDDGDIHHPGLDQQQIVQNEDSGSYRLHVLQKFEWTIQDLCELEPTCRADIAQPNLPISFRLQQILMTRPFRVERGNIPYRPKPDNTGLDMLNRGKIRIRVEWNFQGICDEELFQFQIGDQLRILEVL